MCVLLIYIYSFFSAVPDCEWVSNTKSVIYFSWLLKSLASSLCTDFFEINEGQRLRDYIPKTSQIHRNWQFYISRSYLKVKSLVLYIQAQDWHVLYCGKRVTLILECHLNLNCNTDLHN